MKRVAGIDAAMCCLGPLVTLKDPLPPAAGSIVHRALSCPSSSELFEKGQLTQIEAPLPESTCI